MTIEPPSDSPCVVCGARGNHSVPRVHTRSHLVGVGERVNLCGEHLEYEMTDEQMDFIGAVIASPPSKRRSPSRPHPEHDDD